MGNKVFSIYWLKSDEDPEIISDILRLSEKYKVKITERPEFLDRSIYTTKSVYGGDVPVQDLYLELRDLLKKKFAHIELIGEIYGTRGTFPDFEITDKEYTYQRRRKRD